MDHVAVIVSYLCLAWIILYLLWGATGSGKGWFSHVAGIFFDDYKGGMPLVVLAFPILLATTLSSLVRRRMTEPGHRVPMAFSRLPRSILRCCQGPSGLGVTVGDAAMPRFISLSFLLVVSVYLSNALYRKLQSASEESKDSIIMDVSNAFGIIALIALCLLLVPVTKFSPLVKVFGLSAPTALALHQTIGRFVVIASLVHGSMHSYRWIGLAGENFFSMIIPPFQCWSDNQSADFEPSCRSIDTDCSCYDLAKNLAGVVAGLGLALIGVSSLAFVRRRAYWLFYRIHIVAGPLVFVAVVVHWNRSILYVSGGLLSYMAMYFATATEKLSCWRETKGVTLISVERIVPSEQDRSVTQTLSLASFVSLTFEAEPQTVLQYQPTQYIKLRVPEISGIAHPFSVNRVHGKNSHLRLIIRENGRFTRRLALLCAKPVGNLPRMFVDGFHGTETRSCDILRHDVAVIIAGGIGITTYLTLIREAIQAASRLQTGPYSRNCRLTKILLHWVCREEHLIEYVRKEYFRSTASLMDTTQGVHLSITVHKTMSRHRDTPEGSGGLGPDEESHGATRIQDESRGRRNDGHAFRSSRYSIGGQSSYVDNLPSAVTLLLISVAGLCGIWYLYSYVQSSEEALSRFWVVAFLPLFCLCVGLLVNAGIGICQGHKQGRRAIEFAPIRNSDEVEMQVMGHETNVSISAIGIERQEYRSFSYEEKLGRPSIHSLLNPLEVSKYPAVFSCGPGGLMNEVKDKTLGRCHMRLRRWICGEPRIALYEEAFEM